MLRSMVDAGSTRWVRLCPHLSIHLSREKVYTSNWTTTSPKEGFSCREHRALWGGGLTHSGNPGLSLEEMMFELNLEEWDLGDGGLGKTNHS